MEHYQTDPFADLESVVGVGQVNNVFKAIQKLQPNWLEDSYGIRGPQKAVVRPTEEPKPMVFEMDSRRRIVDVIAPSCPRVTLTCDQVTASKTKCGWVEFTEGGDGKIWLTKTVVQNVTFEVPNGSGCDCDITSMGSTSSIDVYTVDPDTCAVTCARSGSASCSDIACKGNAGERTLFSKSYTRNDGSGDDCVYPYQGSGTVHEVVYNCFGDVIFEGDVNEVDTLVYGEYLPSDCAGALWDTEDLTPTIKTLTSTETWLVGSATATLSDENTEDVCATAVANLPAYDDDFDDPCFASLNSSEVSCTVTRFKPRFTIVNPLDYDLIICYNEHYVPVEGDPIDTPRTVTIPIGETEIIGDEVLEPIENGVITITDITNSCVSPDGCVA